MDHGAYIVAQEIRYCYSVSTQLANELVTGLKAQGAEVTTRETYSDPLITMVNADTVSGYFTMPDDRTPAQNEAVRNSDQLAVELAGTDVLVLAVPMYNFTISAGMKTYFDLVARVGITFKYEATGPVGLLENKKAYVLVATGGTPADSPADFASDYIKFFLAFLGIKDVSFVYADALGLRTRGLTECLNCRLVRC